MQNIVSRRNFVRRAATTGTALCASPMLRAASGSSGATTAAKSAPTQLRASWPVWDSAEEAVLLEVLNSGQWGRSSGKKVREFEEAFARRMKARFCVATSSGTTALMAALGATGLGPGDEVILPPYTFVATFNAITLHYALPVFVDTDAATFQIDPTKIPAAITPATKVLLPVHIGGAAADLDAVLASAKPRRLAVIEDAAQAPVAEWRDRPVGTMGAGGCFSFQASKNLTSGEGGAIVTNDESFASLCYNFHSPSGQKPAPSTGRAANFRLTEFQAGLLLRQMARLDAQAKTRSANAARLDELLGQIPGITPARQTSGCTRNAWHLYMFRYDKRQFADLPRARFIQALASEGVSCSSGYGPLNRSAHVHALANHPHYHRIYGKSTMAQWLERIHCPVNDRLCEEAVWFTHTKLLGTRREMEDTAEAIARVQKRAANLARG